MPKTIRKVGKAILAVGIVMLLAGLVCTMTVGTIAVPILISSSIIVNSVGISMMRHGK